ncbi:MAG: purine-binding chemotaxis protein CheW [Planctomycetes bacterium]|nr:purine-binding chemotaxis protein CheW [Planctomycetota bacterium]
MNTPQPAIPSALSDALGGGGDKENKFLTFRLGQEEYGVEILKVREIIGIIDVTPLPQTPDYVKGVINLRGKIIPVIELRAKFTLPTVEYTEETCVIVMEVSEGDESEQFQMGVIVDSVNEVLDISRNQIEPAPRFGCALNTEYILGVGKVTIDDKEKVIILLEIDKVLTESEVESIRSASRSRDTDRFNEENAQTAA